MFMKLFNYSNPIFYAGIHYPSAAGSSPNLLESTMSGARNLSRPGTAAGVDPDSGNDEEDRPEVAAEKENKTDDEPRVVVVGPRGINRLNCKLFIFVYIFTNTWHQFL